MPLQLRTSSERFDPLLGDSTNLHTQVSDDLTGELIFSGTVKLTAFNLDVDGDGSVSLYTDGILRDCVSWRDHCCVEGPKVPG